MDPEDFNPCDAIVKIELLEKKEWKNAEKYRCKWSFWMQESLSGTTWATHGKKSLAFLIKMQVGDLYSNMYWTRSKTQHLRCAEKADVPGTDVSETSASSEAIYGANLVLSEQSKNTIYHPSYYISYCYCLQRRLSLCWNLVRVYCAMRNYNGELSW